jgi:hypothetical protein
MWLVDLFEYMTMHGLTNPEFKYVNLKGFWLNLANTSGVEFKIVIQDIHIYWRIMSGRKYSSMKDLIVRYIQGLK